MRGRSTPAEARGGFESREGTSTSSCRSPGAERARQTSSLRRSTQLKSGSPAGPSGSPTTDSHPSRHTSIARAPSQWFAAGALAIWPTCDVASLARCFWMAACSAARPGSGSGDGLSWLQSIGPRFRASSARSCSRLRRASSTCGVKPRVGGQPRGRREVALR